MSRPEDVLYARTHEWVRIEDGVATVGITDYAVEQLGDLAFVDLPPGGTEVRQGERFGEIESTKTVSDLLAPVSGEVIEVNTKVDDNVDLVSDSPYETGWLVKIRCTSPDEAAALLGAADYEATLEDDDA